MAARILMRVKSSLILVFSASIRPARPPSSCPASPDTSFCLMASTSTTLVAGYLACRQQLDLKRILVSMSPDEDIHHALGVCLGAGVEPGAAAPLPPAPRVHAVDVEELRRVARVEAERLDVLDLRHAARDGGEQVGDGVLVAVHLRHRPVHYELDHPGQGVTGSVCVLG